jgi:hypothetical protein
MEKTEVSLGTRVEKFCTLCNEERGHVVVSLTKKGMISRVTCPKCGTKGTYKSELRSPDKRMSTRSCAPYDRTRTYRTGQVLMHPTYGVGEVTAVIETLKIDVLFEDKLRRLIHSQP